MLTRRCNEGELTPDARAECEMYVMAGEFVAVFESGRDFGDQIYHSIS